MSLPSPQENWKNLRTEEKEPNSRGTQAEIIKKAYQFLPIGVLLDGIPEQRAGLESNDPARGNLQVCAVLGFLPTQAFLFRTVGFPKPEILTVSPLSNACAIISDIISANSTDFAAGRFISLLIASLRFFLVIVVSSISWQPCFYFSGIAFFRKVLLFGQPSWARPSG